MIPIVAAIGSTAALRARQVPDTARWSVSSVGPPAGAPVIAGSTIVVPLQGGGIAGHHLSDGSHAWTRTLAADKPLTADADQVYVPVAGAIHALDARTGDARWRAELGGAATAPPLVHAGWLIVAAGGEVIAFRAADGGEIWRRPAGAVEFRPAIDGDLLVVPVADGHLLGLDVTTGAVRWRFEIGVSPSDPFVVADRVYVGARDKFFYTLRASTGRMEQHRFVGAVLMGRPAADERHVYFAALDNVLWALDRGSGAIQWRKGLPYRPAAGPVLLGSHVVVPGPVDSLPSFEARTGAPGPSVRFPARLVALPLVEQPAEGPVFAVGITGTLEDKWQVTLLEPSPVPPLPIVPLTVLPGEAVPLPGVPPIGRPDS